MQFSLTANMSANWTWELGWLIYWDTGSTDDSYTLHDERGVDGSSKNYYTESVIYPIYRFLILSSFYSPQEEKIGNQATQV